MPPLITSPLSRSDCRSTQSIGNNYELPAPLASTSPSALKDRIRNHYEIASEYYHSLWGEHIHHGYFKSATDTKEVAQTQLMDLLLERSELHAGSEVLDVGCGIGGTSRYLARKLSCAVTGITISGQQVQMARKISADEGGNGGYTNSDPASYLRLGKGRVRYVELDAEKMGQYFHNESAKRSFDCIWISEALSHLPDKALFFANSATLLRKDGKLVIADWFRAEDLTAQQMAADIQPIADGMLLPRLHIQAEYLHLAESAGLEVFSPAMDISNEVSKTWDISWSLIQSPALWAFAFSQGRDGIAFLQAFRAMRRGFANGTFRYAVMVYRKR